MLKPGGRVLVLEISRPASSAGYLATKLFLKHMVPNMVLLLCRDRDARRMMRYFWDSIDACASREAILASMNRSGFSACRNDREFGIFSAFSGVKAEP